MQSRLSTAAVRFNRILFVKQRLGYAFTGRTADHAVEHQDEKLRHRSDNDKPTSTDNESYVPPKSPRESSPKLESSGVAPPTEPIKQQKRSNSAVAGKLDEMSCAGIDGSPWPEEERETDLRRQREEQERDDKEYYKHHKALPLSEMEMADTRKPITVATDGNAGDESERTEGGVWRTEQLDTAEEALRRAAEIFRWNAIRGDPDSPHGRVLRQLRGEYW